VKVLRLTRTEAATAMLLPAVLGRVVAFLGQYEPGVDPEPLIDALWKDFGAGSNQWLLLAYVDDSGELKGHLLAGLVNHYNLLACRIYQVHHDTDVGFAFDELVSAEQQVVAWAEQRRCRLVECYPASTARSRLFARCGYTPQGDRLTKRVLGRV